jgi:hypothetical protein
MNQRRALSSIPTLANSQLNDRDTDATPFVFLHIPKNAGAAIEYVTMTARDKLAARHPHTHSAEWAPARKGFQDFEGRVHIGSSVTIKVPVEAGPNHPASNDTCKCSVRLFVCPHACFEGCIDLCCELFAFSVMITVLAYSAAVSRGGRTILRHDAGWGAHTRR